jgi:hypothetical protein
MRWVCSLSTREANRIIFALFYVQVYLVGLLKTNQFYALLPFVYFLMQAKVHKRAEPKMAIINNRMVNKMAITYSDILFSILTMY